MAEFASLDNSGSTIPSASPSTERLGLTVPGDVITGTTAGMQSLGSQNIRSDSINRRIVVNDGNNNRIFFGKIGTGTNDYGLKVSKTGINVDAATNDQLIFNSSQDVFKIVKTGLLVVPGFSFTAGAGTYAQGGNTASVAHGLSYKPAILAYFSDDTGAVIGYQVPHSTITSLTAGGFSFSFIEAAADQTNVYVSINTFGINTSYTWANVTIKYYLLQESTSST